MDQNNQQPQSTAPMTPPMAHRKVGPIITVLVIVLILIIGALYLFASKTNAPAPENTMTNDATAASQEVQPVTNTSDDVSSIEADLNASTQGLDQQNF